MSKAIGMVEYKTVSTGMTAADNMVKTSNVEILQASTVCPGKYIVLITGELSAVREVEVALVLRIAEIAATDQRVFAVSAVDGVFLKDIVALAALDTAVYL